MAFGRDWCASSDRVGCGVLLCWGPPVFWLDGVLGGRRPLVWFRCGSRALCAALVLGFSFLLGSCGGVPAWWRALGAGSGVPVSLPSLRSYSWSSWGRGRAGGAGEDEWFSSPPFAAACFSFLAFAGVCPRVGARGGCGTGWMDPVPFPVCCCTAVHARAGPSARGGFLIGLCRVVGTP